MSAPDWLSLLTCAGMLALAVVGILRVRASSLAAPLSVLCLLCFVVRFSGWAQSVSGGFGWPYFVRLVYPWIPPAALGFVLAFLGLRTPLRALSRAARAYALALSALAALGLVVPSIRSLASSGFFQGALALEMFVCAAIAVFLLLRHVRTHDHAEEQLRTRIMLALSALGLLLPLVPYLLPGSHLLLATLMLLFLSLLTTVTFGFQLLETELHGLLAVYTAALLIMAVGGYMVASRLLAASWPFVWLSGVAVALCLLALLWQVGRTLLLDHGRTTRLLALGRWSAYMTHDLKNPLAALKGAAQFLLEEHAQGRPLAPHVDMLELLVSESNRLSALIDRYKNFGGVWARKEPSSLNQLAQQSLELFRSAAPPSCVLRAELAEALPDCPLDPQLVLTALENVLSNALEAMPSGGSITVRTRLVEAGTARVQESAQAGKGRASSSARAKQKGEGLGAVQLLSVEDNGRGMTPRQLALAFSEPFSSKEEGRGLGLVQVKGAVEAHGGSVRVYSRLGQGTRVDMSFPAS